MPTHSDVSLEGGKFVSKAIPAKAAELNQQLVELGKQVPKWWEVGAARYREMRANNETPLPGPTILKSGRYTTIPSREKGRELPCRVFEPENGKATGLYLHIHGGGWVLQSENDQDPLLKFFADELQVTVVSVGYRLAPEHPFPAGPHDCFDAVEYLVDHGEEKFGAELKWMGGESAGGHLSALTFFHVVESRPAFEFKGLMLTYGVFNLSNLLPSAYNQKLPAILTLDVMEHFIEAFVPNKTQEERRHPSISPFYTDLHDVAAQTLSKRLPPTFFSVGTADILMDDTVMMGARWQMSGAEATVKIYPGAPHGFTLFPPSVNAESAQFRKDLVEWAKSV